MPITGVIIQVKKGGEADAQQQLDALDNVETKYTGDGVIVVVTDTKTVKADRELTDQLSCLSGVLAASVVFTNVEDTLDTESGAD